MNLTHDAMLVSLRISAWSGRLYDRKASNHVAVHHEASASAGRYNIGNSDSLYRSGHRMGLQRDANPRVSLAAADLSTRT